MQGLHGALPLVHFEIQEQPNQGYRIKNSHLAHSGARSEDDLKIDEVICWSVASVLSHKAHNLLIPQISSSVLRHTFFWHIYFKKKSLNKYEFYTLSETQECQSFSPTNSADVTAFLWLSNVCLKI